MYANGFNLYRPVDIPLDIFVEELKLGFFANNQILFKGLHSVLPYDVDHTSWSIPNEPWTWSYIVYGILHMTWTVSDVHMKPITKFYRIPRNILIDYLKTEGITYEIPPENCHTLRYKIWHFLEVPKVSILSTFIGSYFFSNFKHDYLVRWKLSIQSSRAARMLHYFNTILILVSVFIFCVETLPVLRPRMIFILTLAVFFNYQCLII